MDPEQTEERTYETRGLADRDRKRSLIFTPQYRHSPDDKSNVCVIDQKGTQTFCLKDGQPHRGGRFEASFGFFRKHVVRVGGWHYAFKEGTPSLMPTSSNLVDLFSASTFESRGSLPSLNYPRDCCGVAEVGGHLYVVGGFKRSRDKNKKRQKQKARFKDTVDHDASAVRQMERYNASKKRWETVKGNFPNIKTGNVVAFAHDLPAHLVTVIAQSDMEE